MRLTSRSVSSTTSTLRTVSKVKEDGVYSAAAAGVDALIMSWNVARTTLGMFGGRRAVAAVGLAGSVADGANTSERSAIRASTAWRAMRRCPPAVRQAGSKPASTHNCTVRTDTPSRSPASRVVIRSSLAAIFLTFSV